MKRVILDVIFVLMIVVIGNSFNAIRQQETIEQRIKNFEMQISNQEVIESDHYTKVTYQTTENIAGKIGQSLSDFVIRTVQDSFRLLIDLQDEFKN